jgi:hypothetical protein
VAFYPSSRQSVAAVLLLMSALNGCGPQDSTPSAPSSFPTAQVDTAGGGLFVKSQHEPPGYTRIMLNKADALPTAHGWSAAVDGVWHLNNYPPLSKVSDRGAPCSPPNVWSATYKPGLSAGSGPVTLVGQSRVRATEARYWYIRICLKVGRNGKFENQATGTKMWFLSVGDAPATGHCSIIPIIKGDAVQAIKSDWNAAATFECSGVLPTVRFLQRSPSIGLSRLMSGRFTSGSSMRETWTRLTGAFDGGSTDSSFWITRTQVSYNQVEILPRLSNGGGLDVGRNQGSSHTCG